MVTTVDFSSAVEDRTLVTGGHFAITAKGPSLNKGTIGSFRQAVSLYAEQKKKRAHLGLGLLINDIGTVCSESACSVQPVVEREEFTLPEEYSEILNEWRVPREELRIFWEKHLRNRGKKLLRKQLAKKMAGLSSREGEYIYQSTEKELPILLTRKSTHDEYGTPACPLIMCAYAGEQERFGFRSSMNFYYVGEDNRTNVANHYVIEKGRLLSLRFGMSLDSKNVYLFEDSIMKNF